MPATVLFYGSLGAGHFLHRAGGHVTTPPADFPAAFRPNGSQPYLNEAALYRILSPGWTPTRGDTCPPCRAQNQNGMILDLGQIDGWHHYGCWDRSADPRHGSHAHFFVRGLAVGEYWRDPTEAAFPGLLMRIEARQPADK
jgi:hypothetical protein